MSSSYSYFLACPPEIHLEILDRLKGDWNQNALKKFSKVSKLCRDRALPFLFVGLWLNRESLAAFSDGGALSSIRSSVRTLYISNRRVRRGKVYDSSNLVEFLTLHAKSLHLFPSATNISIFSEFAVPSYIQNNLYIALWRAISSFPNFKNITLTHDSYRFRARQFRDPPRDLYKIFMLKLTPEAREFLGPVEISDEDLQNGIAFPQQAFETLDINIYELELQRQPGFSSKTFFFGHCSETLKSLNLRVDSTPAVAGQNSTPITIRFPNVTKIKLKGRFCGSCAKGLTWFAQTCPNVESFKLHLSDKYRSGLSLAEYEEFTPMHKLKFLEIPWPRGETERYKKPELNKFIRDLMYAGLENLETVSFARLPLWNKYANDYIFRGCRIERGYEDKGTKIWWKKSYRHIEVNLKGLIPDQTEFEGGEDSGDDWDENPPEGAELNAEWRVGGN